MESLGRFRKNTITTGTTAGGTTTTTLVGQRSLIRVPQFCSPVAFFVEGKSDHLGGSGGTPLQGHRRDIAHSHLRARCAPRAPRRGPETRIRRDKHDDPVPYPYQRPPHRCSMVLVGVQCRDASPPVSSMPLLVGRVSCPRTGNPGWMGWAQSAQPSHPDVCAPVCFLDQPAPCLAVGGCPPLLNFRLSRCRAGVRPHVEILAQR